MWLPFVQRAAILAGAAALSLGHTTAAVIHSIDTDRSTLTVYVYKSGLLSAFGDNHVVTASIADGSFNDGPAPEVRLSINAAGLVVSDPGLASERRAQIQERMRGPEVLDVVSFPVITFESTSIVASGPEQWTVSGRLTLHGRTRPITFAVSRADGRYHGSANVRQTDFGIEPVRVAAGAVKVKDEIRIVFDVVEAPSRTSSISSTRAAEPASSSDF